jgi:multidrug resistance efflux pump
MTMLDTPRLISAPADAPRQHRAATGSSSARRGRRSWTAWLVLIAVLAAAGYGGYRLVDHRIAASSQVSLNDVVLAAEPMPVGSPDAAVVSSVAVSAGESVRAGATLAVIQLTSPADGTEQTVELTAPTAARVVGVDAQPGSVVRAGESVVTLYDPQLLTFQTKLTIADVEDLAVGMTATISGPGLSDPVKATVQRVVPVMGETSADTATMTVVLVPVDPSSVAQLVPGVPLRGTLDTTSSDGGSVLDAGA